MKRQVDRQTGQVLVQVALMMVVLLGFLALAVDVSQVYLKRRQLQNAADAGALEGARHICFVAGATTTSALSAARDVARANAPGSSPLATRDDWRVTVVVTETIPSFVASVVGQDVFNPGARATAVCGAADRSVGGIWPISMYEYDWDDIECGGTFSLFTDQNPNQAIVCNPCAANDPTCVPPAGACDCNKVIADGNNAAQICIPDPIANAQLTGDGAPMRIAPGERAWMNLFVPEPPYPLPPINCGYGSCGSASVACWAEQLHPGPISVCDQIRTQQGVTWSNGIRDAACMHANLGSQLSIPLWRNNWQDVCPSGLNPELGCGSNTAYPITDFGCLEILGFSTSAWIPYPDGTPDCEKNLKVIYGRKLCSGCESFQGGTGGGPPEQGVRAVSLIE